MFIIQNVSNIAVIMRYKYSIKALIKKLQFSMITETQKQLLKEHLKYDYVNDVLEILSKNNVKTRDDNDYSPASVRAVFNGRVANVDIEDAILQVYTRRKLQYEKREAKKSKLLAS